MTMRRLIMLFIASAVCYSIQEMRSPRTPLSSAEIAPVQLKGLTSIFVGAYVDNDIPHYKDIEERIKNMARKMLAGAGLSLKGEQGADLFVKVTLFPIQDKTVNKYVLVQVRTTLTEKVSLRRDPLIKLPNDAITWEWSWVELKKPGALGSFVEEEAVHQVEIFCDLWSHVNRL
jgi:hypothetical protein